jgi:hypothetical protein
MIAACVIAYSSGSLPSRKRLGSSSGIVGDVDAEHAGS